VAGARGLLGAKFSAMETRAPITVFDLAISDFNNLTQRVLDAYEAKSGRTLSSLDCSERRRAVKELDAIGFFGLKGATMAFANRALISKVTAYKALYASMESK
jgi:predicted transcriptional regulator YheO